jgi:hypothetical protein
MKKILLVLVLMFLFLSCKEEAVAKPDRLIAKEKMIDIMYDIAVLEGIKYQNPASLDSNKINSVSYIYKKYKIDSLQLAQSNVYYSSDYVEYKNMYDTLVKRIERKKNLLDSVIKKEQNFKNRKDSIQAKRRIKKDTLSSDSKGTIPTKAVQGASSQVK